MGTVFGIGFAILAVSDIGVVNPTAFGVGTAKNFDGGGQFGNEERKPRWVGAREGAIIALVSVGTGEPNDVASGVHDEL